ncbi:MAG: apolipoprotein N-acyltransferase, partial [Acidobacteriota bacterium]
SVAGVYGLSFLIVLFQCMFLYSINFRKKSPFLTILIILLVLHAGGFLRVQSSFPEQNQFTASVIQGNVSSDIYWDTISPEYIEELFQRHLQLTRTASKDGSRLIIWPEFSIPLCFSCPYGIYQKFKDELSNLVQEENLTLLLGTNEKKEDPEKTNYYNTALCLKPDLSYSTYYKMHLVPFGEYTPYPEILSFINKVTHAIGEITPGEISTLHYYQNMAFASPICYEIIFPGLVRNFVRKDAQFITTITNDGWYGTSSAPYQHFSIAVFRAVENKRYLLRAATTGISGIIDPFGRIIQKSSLNEQTHLTASIIPIKEKTIYCRTGDILPLFSLTITAACFILALRKKYNERKKIRRNIL